MADITVTAAKVGRAAPGNDEVYPFIAGTTITAGQPVYFNTSTGKLAVGDASSAGSSQIRGIALNGAVANGPVSVLKRGFIYGYTLSGDYDSRAYLSNTAGSLGDAAGDTSVTIGRVAQFNGEKVLFVDCDWLTQAS